MMKNRRIPHLKKLNNIVKDYGINEKIIKYQNLTDTIGRERQKAVADPAVCVFYNSHTIFNNIDDIVGDINRYHQYYIPEPLKFVSDPGESKVCYDGASKYDLNSLSIAVTKQKRKDKYKYSAKNWEWYGGPCEPYLTTKHAVYIHNKNLRSVLVPIDTITRLQNDS